MKSYFFNAEATSDLVNHPTGYDREYDADDHAAFFEPFFTGGGVFAGANADACRVSVRVGSTLAVAAGAVYARGRMAVFDGTETVAVTEDCHIVARMDKSKDVRAFRLLAVPEVVQDLAGDVYDVELATAAVTPVTGGHEVRVTDARTFMAFTGQPPYYPPSSDNLPYALWLYVLGLPLTEEQRAAVEGTPGLMDLFYASLGASRADTVSFAEADWSAAGSDGLRTLTIPKERHGRPGAAFGCTLRHQTAAGLRENTWAARCTDAAYDAATGAITLRSADAYAGEAVFYAARAEGGAPRVPRQVVASLPEVAAAETGTVYRVAEGEAAGDYLAYNGAWVDLSRDASSFLRWEDLSEVIALPEPAGHVTETVAMESGNIHSSTGGASEDASRIRSRDFVPAAYQTKYALSNTAGYNMYILFYDREKNFLWHEVTLTGSGTFRVHDSRIGYFKLRTSGGENDLSAAFTLDYDVPAKGYRLAAEQVALDHGYEMKCTEIQSGLYQAQVQQQGDEFTILAVKAPAEKPHEATLALSTSGAGLSQFVDFSCMHYESDTTKPGTVEIVCQTREGKPLPPFSVRFNDGAGAGRVAKLTVEPDAIPLALTAAGLKVRRDNTYDNAGAEADYATVDLAALYDDVQALKAQVAALQGGAV